VLKLIREIFVLKKFYILTSLSLILLFSGCSTQKNTWLSRNYHNLTAHFNVYFNGNQSYKKGVDKYNNAFHDDYSRILPVYNYGDKDAAANISPEMSYAQKKAAKLISLHSIKVKPKFKKGKLTQEQKEILDINEYNKWVDDAYLMIGKASFYILDYDKATEAFNFTVREFQKQEASYIAQIWLAKLNVARGEFKDAEKILDGLEKDRKFPKKLTADFLCTSAYCALKQNQIEKGTKLLEKAMPLVKGKTNKLRVYYILAQLYQKQKQNHNAILMFNKVIKKSPPYEMSFNAQISLASLVQSGTKDSYAVKQQLLKMARSEKNKDYLDLIYYAIGNIDMNAGNDNMAIDDYKKSVSLSTTNTDQKTLSCITLANYFYDHKNYVPAQAYYDTAITIIKSDYPNIDLIKSRAASLGKLVKCLNTISREDSLQRVSLMPEKERNAFIDKIISDLKKKELEEQMAEAQRLQDLYSSQTSQYTIAGSQAKASWYFYNPSTVAQGMKDFQLKWGKRKLADNWRRKNKSDISTESDIAENTAGDEDNPASTATKKVKDNKSREYYIQDLPLTDSLRQVSTKKIINAYFEGGQVYKNELSDLPPGIELYEEMLKRFPNSDYKLPVYYQLYMSYHQVGNETKSLYYKNLILNQYPESTFAKVIKDPEYYKQIEEKDKEAERFYEQTYNLYQSGNYSQVIVNSDNAVQKYPDDKVIPNFVFIRALAIGKTGDLLRLREELNKIIENYPKHEIAGQAKDILNFMNNYKPETKKAEDTKIAEVIYTINNASEYYFAVVVNKTEDINQISFDIINFNLDNFSNEKYDVNRDDLGKDYKIITVHGFKSIEAVKKYYSAFFANVDVIKNVKGNKSVFYISPENFMVLQKQKDADSYTQYFKIHFIEIK
jgi:tetratricopeptide (TPR) repeat protein